MGDKMIAIIEDDIKIRNELNTLLSRYNYKCLIVTDFKNVVDTVIGLKPELILLDINLPYFDGYYICREIRKKSNIPIIVVTSRNSDIDELMSMNLGADDFMSKPYNTQILIARISSVLRRTQGDTNIIEYKGISLNISKSELAFNQKTIELTKNELRILQLLMKNRGSIISRNDIINELWQSDEFIDDNTLTVNINRLRKKLKEINITDFLITKRGQGYII